MTSILKKLHGGDLRSIGCANEAAHKIENNPALFQEVFDGLYNDDPIIRMRSDDAIEKATKNNPKLLSSFTTKIISILASAKQQEVCWHTAQIAPRLVCNKKQENEIVELLKNYLTHKSKIVRVEAMESLAIFTVCL